MRRLAPVTGGKLYLKYHLASTDNRADGEGGSSINRLFIAALDARALERRRIYEGKPWTEAEFAGLKLKGDALYPVLQPETGWRV